MEPIAEESVSPGAVSAGFDDMWGQDSLATTIGLAPVAAMESTKGSASAVVSYHIATLSGAAALHIVHTADSIIGRIVDFTG